MGGLARSDFNVNGPIGDDWRFNFGGYYRYNRGVRDPGFPGTRGGQLKASVTRNLANGYFRTTLKYIRSEEHTSELQSQSNLVCRLLLEKKKKSKKQQISRIVSSDYHSE